MKLTPENYYSLEANNFYMSNSTYGDFLKCESMALAKLRGEIIPSPDAFLLGNYVHAWAEGTLGEFRANNPELFGKNGQLYAKYAAGDTMIDTLSNDALIRYLMTGDREIIVTAMMFGVPWKAKLDILASGWLADIKTTKGIYDKHWDPRREAYVNFVEFYNYVRQMAVYSELERISKGRDERLESYIIAVSKEDIPDKAVISFDEESLQGELDNIAINLPRIMAVKNGHEQPRRCGRCEHCRRTNVLKRVVHYSDILI